MRWGILGAGVISGDFAEALRASADDAIIAVGGRDPERREAFAAAHAIPVTADYGGLLARDDIDAVYIGTVHPAHAGLVLAALDAGKAVLCEKPLTPDAATTERLIAAARDARLPLVEAFKYRFVPTWTALRRLVEAGEIGDIESIESSFGFAAPARSGRLFDPSTAGGAILDVGCYPVSLVVGVAEWTGASSCRVASVDGVIGETGVDERASATVVAGDLTANIRTAITQELPRRTTIRGSHGTIEIPNVWGSRVESDPRIVVRRDGRPERGLLVSTDSPMGAEARAVGEARRVGETEAPAMPWRESLAVARVLDEWRDGLT